MQGKIAIHDADNTLFPNLALMKISAYYKSKGNKVDWFSPLEAKKYLAVFSSSVFTFKKGKFSNYLPEHTVYGGTGYNKFCRLPEEAEKFKPDYEIYGIDYSLGFITRGCPNKCFWCIVPEKEGGVKPNAEAKEIIVHDKAVLLDNNILASQFGIEQLEEISKMEVKIDLCQGIDSRYMDKEIAHLFSKIKWLKPVRLACDNQAQKKPLEKAVHNLREADVTPKRYSCYVLLKNSIDDAYDRVMFAHSLGVNPFVMPYRDFNSKNEVPYEHRKFARWVNHKAVFKSTDWENYRLNYPRKRQRGNNAGFFHNI